MVRTEYKGYEIIYVNKCGVEFVRIAGLSGEYYSLIEAKEAIENEIYNLVEEI